MKSKSRDLRRLRGRLSVFTDTLATARSNLSMTSSIGGRLLGSFWTISDTRLDTKSRLENTCQKSLGQRPPPRLA